MPVIGEVKQTSKGQWGRWDGIGWKLISESEAQPGPPSPLEQRRAASDADVGKGVTWGGVKRAATDLVGGTTRAINEVVASGAQPGIVEGLCSRKSCSRQPYWAARSF